MSTQKQVSESNSQRSVLKIDKLQRQKNEHSKTLHQTLLLGIFFVLLTLTYSSFSTIITYIYEQYEGYQYLGPLLLAVNYGTFMIANIFVPFLKISFKKQFLFGAFCYTFNYALQISNKLDIFGVFLLIFGSAIGGLGAAVVWICQGGFMSVLLEHYNIPFNYKGRYFGILNMITYSNIILGSVVTTFGLGFMSDTFYFIILTIIGLVSLIFCSIFIENINPKTSIAIKRQDLDENTDEQFALQDESSINQLSILRKLQESIIKIIKFSKKLKNIIPLIFTDGLILGFISSSITNLLPLQNHSKIQAGIFLIFLGCGAIIGGFLSGYFSDKFVIIKVGKSTILFLGLVIFLTLLTFFMSSLAYSYFLAFVWGFSWHYMDGWLWVLCTKKFNGRLEAFALNKFIHSFSFVIYQVSAIIYGNQDKSFFISIFLVILTFMLIISLIFLLKQERLIQIQSNL